MESIEELRKICQTAFLRERANPYGRFIRTFSIYITRFLIPTKVTPNSVSGAMIFVGVLASCFFLFPSRTGFFVGAMLLQFWYALDGADGELARYRYYQRTGKMVMDKRDGGLTGMYIDMLNHYIINLLVPVTVSFGLFQQRGSSFWIFLGILGAVFQVLMLAIHDAQSRTILTHLKRFNYIEVIKVGTDAASEVKAKNQRSLPHWIFIALHHTLTYPAVMNLTGIAAIFNFVFPSWEWRVLFLHYVAWGTAVVSVSLIVRAVLLKTNEQELNATFKVSDAPRETPA